MKKKLAFLSLMVAIIMVPFVAFGAGTKITALLAPHVNIVTEGKNLNVSDNPPIIYDGKTYVPLRTVSEALGYDVSWDGKRQTVEMEEPADGKALIKRNGIEIDDYVAKPDAMKTFDIISGKQEVQVIYTIEEKLSKQASVTLQVLNKNKKVVTFGTAVLKETQPGTYTQTFYTEYFHLPYEPSTTNLGHYEEKMAEDYTYRLKVN